MGDEIMKLSGKYGCAVWDFYSVMGGLNSVSLWYKEDLVKNDKIHFTREGYILKADLLFNAIMKSYDNYLIHHTSQRVLINKKVQ